MKLRGVHIKGKSSFRDVSLDFMTDEGEIVNQALIRGNLATGKTLILQLAASAWSRSVLNHPNLDLGIDAEMIRIDYQVGAEVASVHVRNGQVEPSPTLAKAASVEVGDKNPHVHHGVVYYAANRENYVEFTKLEGSVPSGLRRCLPIIYDLQTRDIRDSVVLVDDWDLGLDEENRKSFYTYISRHANSKGNQLVLSSALRVPAYFPERGVFELTGGADVTSESLKLLALVEGGI